MIHLSSLRSIPDLLVVTLEGWYFILEGIGEVPRSSPLLSLRAML